MLSSHKRAFPTFKKHSENFNTLPESFFENLFYFDVAGEQ